MKFIVLSDTHIPERKENLPDQLWKEIANSDGVIHAGDFTSYDFYEFLKKKVGNLYTVKGNMDDSFIKLKLPEKLIFTIDEITIGLMHGYGAPQGLEDVVYNAFSKDNVNIIIFGHSHKPLQLQKDKVFLLNPGTPTDYVFATKQTYAILFIEKNKFSTEIITLQ